LPEAAIRPQTPPKQLRETNLLDIEGAHPKPLYPYRMRNPIGVSDIEGAYVGWKPHHKQVHPAPKDNISCQDINGDGLFKSTRHVDPLSPRYQYDVPEITDDAGTTSRLSSWRIGDVAGNKPRSPPKAIADHNSLEVHDIPGAYAGYLPPVVHARRHYRNTNFVGDIEGTQPGFQPFRTTRTTNPLSPSYALLDGTNYDQVEYAGQNEESKAYYQRKARELSTQEPASISRRSHSVAETPASHRSSRAASVQSAQSAQSAQSNHHSVHSRHSQPHSVHSRASSQMSHLSEANVRRSTQGMGMGTPSATHSGRSSGRSSVISMSARREREALRDDIQSVRSLQ
jgi:hypothetical protein